MPINHQRGRRITSEDTYDDITHYTPPARQSSQSMITVNNNDVKKTRFLIQMKNLSFFFHLGNWS
jgi:hypothetical protein